MPVHVNIDCDWEFILVRADFMQSVNMHIDLQTIATVSCGSVTMAI